MGELIIFKYTFEVDPEVEIEMPKGAHILTVQVQHGYPTIWAIVDPEQPKEIRHLRLFGTGHPLDIDPAASRYIGTFQLDMGNFVGHLFEAK